ncbi:uncharacterized protein GIQ15_04700 [Arthroderma uncinatum]|uniref:uncharacterized protein n=1 Tax=Arthroderma uncinatum TaxID=74035 RepID=UPI00144A6ABC|nr:uncharacterized protein GIQ15_04700 [Arthroderma uncinatum]KAF3481941.1 hypothetical protein GIQ15_04700 [Arthroderma uncinatum]
MTSGEQNKSIYGSPYMAEFYELRWACGVGLEDVELVYWPAFVEMFSKHPRGAQFTFIDIGTGGGRSILGLLDKAVAESFEIPLGSAQFIGMDIEENMLDYAAREASKHPGISPVTWSLGSALALDKLRELADRKTTVDMLIFTYGSIAHLTGDGELGQFFTQVSRVLTPGSGRAYVDFFDDIFIPHGQDGAKMEDASTDAHPDVQSAEIKSIQWPGISYQMETSKFVTAGVFCDADLMVHVVREDKTVVQSNSIHHHLRIHREDHVQAASREAGLVQVGKKSCMKDTVFIFQKPA